MKAIRFRPKVMVFGVAQGQGSRIGYNPDEDRNHFHVTASGLVVAPLGEISYFARDSRDKNPRYHE